MKQIKDFKPGDRVYDAIYELVGIVYMVDDISVQVAFPENITKHGGRLNYARAYELKYFIKNSRLQIVTDNFNIIDLDSDDYEER